jgi:cytoskeletal protein RodZ
VKAGDEMVQIGEILKEARISKGYTLDDLQQTTKIQKRYLIAIEEGNFDIMPGNFYVRAFIKQYADTVGLDGDRLLEEHSSVLPEIHMNKVEETPSFAPSRTNLKKAARKTNFDYSETMQHNMPTILLGVLVVAIVAVIWNATLNQGNENTQIDVASNVSQTVSMSQSTSESATAEPSAVVEKNPQTIALVSSDGETAQYNVGNMNFPAKFTVSANEMGDAWISISVNGIVQNSGIVASGKSFSVDLPQNATEIEVVSGYLPATVIDLNGTVVTMPENYQAVTTQTLLFSIKNAE